VLKINVTFGPFFLRHSLLFFTHFFLAELKYCRFTRPFAWEIHLEVGENELRLFHSVFCEHFRADKKIFLGIRDFKGLGGCVLLGGIYRVYKGRAGESL